MAEGRVEQLDRLLWNHTSSVLAMMVNTVPFRSSRKLAEPAEFNPYEAKRRRSRGFPITADSISMLQAFLPPEKRAKLAQKQ